MARALADAGASVVCSDLDGERAGQVADGLGGRSWGAELDVRDAGRVEDMTAETLRRLGRLDTVFCNAGVNGPAGLLHEVPPDEWTAAIDVNLGGVVNCCRAAARAMIMQGRPGKIINTASAWGLRAVALRPMPAYAASKGAVINLTRELAVEYADHGITVNAIAPLGFQTNIGGGRTFADPAQRQRLVEKIPLRRLAQPGEIGGLAVFLASSAADFITGSVITIDGGFSAV